MAKRNKKLPTTPLAQSSSSRKSRSIKVGVIMGSDSDWNVMKAATEILAEFGVGFEKSIVSAHRTPERLYTYAKTAHERGLQVIIAGAGGAAHLPGMVASITPLPVIGVPVRSRTMDGLDSLLSIAQMPKGIPVATVAVDNSSNAALLAIRILSLQDPKLFSKLEQYIRNQTNTVLKKAKKFGRSK